MSSLTASEKETYWANRKAGIRGQGRVASAILHGGKGLVKWITRGGAEVRVQPSYGGNRASFRKKVKDPQYTKPNHGKTKDNGR